ncbi:MAG: MaoC family dehydratase N-terminal domain-containing protein [Halieaceae bacterium]
MSLAGQSVGTGAELQHLLGQRLGPYNSFNPVNRAQIWQWCSAMGDGSPLYLDEGYQARVGLGDPGAVAPPAMMQMWTMRDVDDNYAPGSTRAHPYPAMQALEQLGFQANVAVSYDLQFHRYLREGDRVHHYKTVVEISALKRTALGEGYFFTDRMEYLDQNDELFAEALITYFQYCPAADNAQAGAQSGVAPPAAGCEEGEADEEGAASPGSDLKMAQLQIGQQLPRLVIPITHKLIVAGALASQDFIPVHHNLPAAQAAGMPDIFMNILTSCGLAARYLTDWAGPGSRLRRLQFRLLAPNLPGDSMSLQGELVGLEATGAGDEACVEFAGVNSRGPHLSGRATLALASN